MDHLDWLDAKYASDIAAALAQQVVPGGVVIWRSASVRPFYAPIIAAAGFDVRCISTSQDGYMDRVNMYSSFYVATRKAHTD
jgi:betaine lipid synthase